jgi:exopolyphosphatase/guanosine-5'-triphosphate,3'-diphosphate pyrophosphatase
VTADPSSSRVAAIDIGSNTCLLLVAEGTADAPIAVHEASAITRLGKGVDRTGRLADDAMDRALAVLADYGRRLREHGVASVDAVCTSAVRDAANGEDFLSRAASVLGKAPRVVLGREEGSLTFDGVTTALSDHGTVTVFDIGGGSTEVIHGPSRGSGAPPAALGAASMNVGSVRLTERHLAHDPPTPMELAALREDIDDALLAVPRTPTNELVGVAGTITTLATLDRRLPHFDPLLVHGALLTRASVMRLTGQLSSMTLEQRIALPGLDPGRADVIVAGATIALAVLDWAGVDVLRVSDRGVRWGVAVRLLRR